MRRKSKGKRPPTTNFERFASAILAVPKAEIVEETQHHAKRRKRNGRKKKVA